MMTTLKNRIESVQDINKYIRVIAAYTWMGAGALFVCYLYFVGSLTFSIVKQQSLQQSIKTTISRMSEQELAYLTTQKDLQLQKANELGLISTATLSFAAPRQRAVAFNVGR